MRLLGNIRSFSSSVILAALLLLLGSAASLQAGPFVMTQTPSIAPNAYMSPSWSSYSFNALVALQAGLTTWGAPGADQYNAVTSGVVLPGDVVVSSFNSWRGVAPGVYAGEYGNRLQFGLYITGNGDTFRLSNLWFGMTSTPDNFFQFTGGWGTGDPYTAYSAYTMGIWWGPDNTKGGGDDVIYTSGAASQLINELIYVGVGNSIDATFEPGATDQAKLNSAMGYVWGMGITNRYCLYSDSEEELVCSDSHVDVVPEPATGLLLLAGFGALVAFCRWRRR
jgi:hypothetical protein